MEKSFISPVYNVIKVPIEKIRANDYNPNSVPPPEMKLLITSILEDGYTTPLVCYYIEDEDYYDIVDGFHRYLAMKLSPEIKAREGNCLPVSVIDKPLANRIASTIRHNRARGVHSIDLMANIVAKLAESGCGDEWIMKHIGMDTDELLRLKQISGLAALFSDREFSQAWESDETFGANK
jgi:ParB-like chromosome segregation protein Spo0J